MSASFEIFDDAICYLVTENICHVGRDADLEKVPMPFCAGQRVMIFGAMNTLQYALKLAKKAFEAGAEEVSFHLIDKEKQLVFISDRNYNLNFVIGEENDIEYAERRFRRVFRCN